MGTWFTYIKLMKLDFTISKCKLFPFTWLTMDGKGQWARWTALRDLAPNQFNDRMDLSVFHNQWWQSLIPAWICSSDSLWKPVQHFGFLMEMHLEAFDSQCKVFSYTQSNIHPCTQFDLCPHSTVQHKSLLISECFHLYYPILAPFQCTKWMFYTFSIWMMITSGPPYLSYLSHKL